MIAKVTAVSAVYHLLKAFAALEPGSPTTPEYEESLSFRALRKFDVIARS